MQVFSAAAEKNFQLQLVSELREFAPWHAREFWVITDYCAVCNSLRKGQGSTVSLIVGRSDFIYSDVSTRRLF